MIQVIIQELNSGAIPPIYDITDRIPKESLSSISEKSEEYRFAFIANDISISNINNFDGFFDDFCFETDFVGFLVTIFLDGAEIYRGDSFYKDISFDDIFPSTVSIRTFTVLNRADRDKYLAQPLVDYTLTSLDNFINEYITNMNVLNYPPVNPNVITDYTGVLDLALNILLGITPTDSQQIIDAWQNPTTGEVYGIQYDTVNDKLIICLLRENGNIPIKSISYADSASYVQFIRARTNSGRFITIKYGELNFFTYDITTGYSYSGNLMHIADQKYFLANGDRVNSIPVYSHNVYTSYLSDGYYNYTVELIPPIPNRYYLNQYLGTTLIRSITINTTNPSYIHTPYRNRIVYCYNLYDNWKWIDMDSSTVIIEGEKVIPDFITDVLTIAYLISDEPTVYPMGHAEVALMGKFCYYKKIIDWHITDPIFIILSSFDYSEPVTLRQVIDDVCQLFNASVWIYNNTIYILKRDNGIGNITVHKDYFSNSIYQRELQDDRNIGKVLKLSIPYPEEKLSRTSILIGGVRTTYTATQLKYYNASHLITALEYYYQFTLQNRYIYYKFEIPLEIGKAIFLGYKVTINPDGISGIVVEKDSEIMDNNKTVKLKVEVKNG